MKVHGALTVPDAAAVVRELERLGSPAVRAGMARFAIPSDKAFGVSVGAMRRMAKAIGRDHALAMALWKTGWYEARMMATLVDDASRVTSAQMDRWCRDFDNWGICDTACFHLFDKTPLAWKKVDAWGRRREEFVKRAAFALLASLAGHDKTAADALFVRRLPLIARAATDDRNFVKKGVSWALRGIGHRNRALHSKAVALAKQLASGSDATARWVGKDTLRDLLRPAVIKKTGRRA